MTRFSYDRGAWRRFGHPSIGGWVAGEDKPGVTNTGHSGTLTTLSGDQTITVAGTVLENRDITGKVNVQAADVTIRNCRVRGNATASSNQGVVQCTSASAVNLLIEDCTIYAATPSIWWTGILGHDYTARRCHIYDVVDGCGVYNTTAPSSPANVVIEGCFIHDLAYRSPDANHGDNHTHNDGIQIQGNTGIIIRGNTIWCNASAGASNATSPYDPSCTGQAIGITPNVSAVTNCLIEDNWLDYGAQSVTVIPGSKGLTTTATIRNNTFGRNQPNLLKDGAYARRTILADPDLALTGLPLATGTDTAGNVYEDTGAAVTVYRTDSY